jgi:hypothetical protein
MATLKGPAAQRLANGSAKARPVRAALSMLLMVLVAGTLFGTGQGRAEPPPTGGSPVALPDDAITVEEIRREGDRAVLKVKNRTPFILIVYVGGVRIGWMRPYRTGVVRGLMQGHHRLYAHSRYGTTSWGPRFIWVPGTWNLLY